MGSRESCNISPVPYIPTVFCVPYTGMGTPPVTDTHN